MFSRIRYGARGLYVFGVVWIGLSAAPVRADDIASAEKAAKAYLESQQHDSSGSIRLKLVDRYEPVRDTEGPFPDGSNLRFLAVAGQSPIVVSLLKQSGRWIVDTRWWDAMRALAGGRIPPEGDPEYTIKSALMLMLQDDRDELRPLFVAATNIDTLFPPQYSAANLDQFFELVREMPVVEITPDELVLGPQAKFIRAGDLPGSPERIFVGQYGATDLIFRMKKEQGAWKLLPAGYLIAMEVW